MDLLFNCWLILVTAAPWLLLGFAIAGLIHAFIPQDLMTKHLGGDGFGTMVKAAFIGAPLPLCSCGVIPAALGLRRSGASKSATVSFLVATPETGVDSVSVSYAMLGPVMAVIRPIAAICSAIVAGALVGKETKPSDAIDSDNETETTCCGQQKPTVLGQSISSVCSPGPDPSTQPTFVDKLNTAFHFSTGKLIADTAPWLVVGIFFAAVVQTFVPTELLASYGQGILAMTVMVLVSIPMYICATASTPIAAGLLFAGVSPGSILVFMLAGPATNIATLGVVGKELGRRSLIAYLFGVVATAMVFGGALDVALAYYNIDIREGIEQHSHFVSEGLSQTLAWILVGLLARAFFNKAKSRFFTASADEPLTEEGSA